MFGQDVERSAYLNAWEIGAQKIFIFGLFFDESK